MNNLPMRSRLITSLKELYNNNNNNNSPENLKKLAVTQTPVKNHQLTLM